MSVHPQPLDPQRLPTVAEIDETIARGRQRYLAAYFAGQEGEAQFWVDEVTAHENLRNLVQRRAAAA